MNASDKGKTFSLSQRIIQQYPQFSRQEKKIANYIVQNIRTAFALSANRMAEQVGASPATIVRFSQHLGFSGFQQLRSQMVNEIQEEMMPEDRFKLLSPDSNQISTVLKIAEQEVKNINETLREIRRDTFEKFIAALNKGRCIYTLGIGISSLLARLSAYLLNQAGLTTQFCLKEEHSFLEKLIRLTKKDVLLGFSFPPYSRDTIRAVKFCQERGVTCLSVTDRPTAPIVQWSWATLLVRTKNLMFTNSLSAVTMLVNAIATEIALLNKNRVVTDIDLINKFLEGDFLS